MDILCTLTDCLLCDCKPWPDCNGRLYNSGIYHSTDDQAYKNSVYSSKRMYLQGLGVRVQGTVTY